MSKIEEYPYNVLYFLFEEKIPEECDITYVINNLDDNIECILASINNELITSFYNLKFRQLKSNLEISDELHIKITRVKNIEKKLYLILSHPSKKNIILYGKECLKITQDIEKLKQDLEKKKEELVFQIINAKVDEEERKKEEFASYINGIKISEMNLSTRVLNALYRNNIFTIGDLLKHDPKEIIGIRNIGVGSFNLLVNELQKAGVNFWHL